MAAGTSGPLTPYEQIRLGEFLHWYPAIEQQRMMEAWLATARFGTWTFSGHVTAADRTVITPNSDMNYGYCWFNLSDGPLVIELPIYRRYLSLSVFDMMHYVPAVLVGPRKPVVIRLASQASPVADAHEVVLDTVCGLAFLRMVVPEAADVPEVMALAEQVRSSGGDGDLPFLVPDFTDEESTAGLDIIRTYALRLTRSEKVFGARTQGVGDLDRCAGVFAGQLGIPAGYVQYTQYVALDGAPLGGDGRYRITVDPRGLCRDDQGYWSITVYDMEDRYLIPNPGDRYAVGSYTSVPNDDGTVTVRINPDGDGENAIPTMGRTVYAIMRVYQPAGMVAFPTLDPD